MTKMLTFLRIRDIDHYLESVLLRCSDKDRPYADIDCSSSRPVQTSNLLEWDVLGSCYQVVIHVSRVLHERRPMIRWSCQGSE